MDKVSTCNARDTGSIPGLGRAIHSSILAWEFPWTEEPGGPQSMGFQELDMTMTKPQLPPYCTLKWREIYDLYIM